MRPTRRSLLQSGGAAALTLACPGILRAAADRPQVTHGVQTGDILPGRAVLWARADRPARALFDWATTEAFADPQALPPLDVLPDSDFTAKLVATGLPHDQTIFYRVRFSDLTNVNAVSPAVGGRFLSHPSGRRDVTFVWSGDTCGQGWGIDAGRGGMVGYATMARHHPDFFIHCGDTIYADGPLQPEVTLKDGTLWRNLMTEEKSRVAQTLDEFRGQYKYNLLDKNLLDFNTHVPMFAQWDDHEVTNNWSDGKILGKAYTEKHIRLLAARAARAFHEFMPIASYPDEPRRVYRRIPYGPLLDVFFLDMRTYRGANGDNLERDGAVFLGRDQLDWLKRALSDSTATWKVIAADMPLSIIVWDDFRAKKGFEAVANAENGQPLGRELDIAELLHFIKRQKIRNTVWLTADVHYTAAHYYNPDKAAFQEFDPFWEFVSGPIHAGSFGPGALDLSFGPEVKYVKAPSPAQGQNLPPSAGLQFFGHVRIDGASAVMTVTLRDTADTALWSIDLMPQT